MEILIVLGSPNSPSGELSDISKNRLDHCKKIFSKGKLVLCTGGWGSHFNTAKKPHAFYAKEYLIGCGLYENDFLESALSQNTVDDAVKIKPILSNHQNKKLTIITSDYHLERVKLIFKEILKDYNMNFTGVESTTDAKKYNLLIEHEKKAIQSILDNGLYY
ncbi:YdcF family protein [Aquimarina sediminis]|uniref:YdcF family protein n=1 Tax=Aquimarina sediminis TaxID=2070536 RepID=UPI000CA05991|nr:YdcF family protein [Aquimarina sediminis]